MPDSVTDKYDLTKPEVEASQDTWGDKLNQNLDFLDELLFNRVVKNATGKDASVAGVHQVMGLHLDLPAQVDAQIAGSGGEVHYTSAATARWVETRILSILNAVFPVGTIMLWSGTVDSTTALNALGWCLCNGTGGSPNLSDRIIISVGAHHAAGEFQGVASPGLGLHTHDVTALVAAGVAGAPEFQNDLGGAAIYYPSQNHLPYYALCYIYKFALFGGGGIVGPSEPE